MTSPLVSLTSFSLLPETLSTSERSSLEAATLSDQKCSGEAESCRLALQRLIDVTPVPLEALLDGRVSQELTQLENEAKDVLAKRVSIDQNLRHSLGQYSTTPLALAQVLSISPLPANVRQAILGLAAARSVEQELNEIREKLGVSRQDEPLPTSQALTAAAGRVLSAERALRELQALVPTAAAAVQAHDMTLSCERALVEAQTASPPRPKGLLGALLSGLQRSTRLGDRERQAADALNVARAAETRQRYAYLQQATHLGLVDPPPPDAVSGLLTAAETEVQSSRRDHTYLLTAGDRAALWTQVTRRQLCLEEIRQEHSAVSQQLGLVVPLTFLPQLHQTYGQVAQTLTTAYHDAQKGVPNARYVQDWPEELRTVARAQELERAARDWHAREAALQRSRVQLRAQLQHELSAVLEDLHRQRVEARLQQQDALARARLQDQLNAEAQAILQLRPLVDLQEGTAVPVHVYRIDGQLPSPHLAHWAAPDRTSPILWTFLEDAFPQAFGVLPWSPQIKLPPAAAPGTTVTDAGNLTAVDLLLPDRYSPQVMRETARLARQYGWRRDLHLLADELTLHPYDPQWLALETGLLVGLNPETFQTARNLRWIWFACPEFHVTVSEIEDWRTFSLDEPELCWNLWYKQTPLSWADAAQLVFLLGVEDVVPEVIALYLNDHFDLWCELPLQDKAEYGSFREYLLS